MVSNMNEINSIYPKQRQHIDGCRLIRINTIASLEAGILCVFESGKDIDFDIKRIYYISNVPEGVQRGFHAHKELKQLLFCPYGRISLLLDDGMFKETIILDNPSLGVVIDKPIWREMSWLKKDSVLVVAASEYYTSEDYIRNYEEFLNFKGIMK